MVQLREADSSRGNTATEKTNTITELVGLLFYKHITSSTRIIKAVQSMRDNRNRVGDSRQQKVTMA